MRQRAAAFPPALSEADPKAPSRPAMARGMARTVRKHQPPPSVKPSGTVARKQNGRL
jgi:hypothetical protein